MATATACSPIPCLEPLPQPTFDPLGGAYTEPKQVAIGCTVDGADIRYTVDGSDPTSASTLYSRAVDVSASMTLRAKAFKTGWLPSPTSSATYSFTCATPAFDPPAGPYGSAQTVRITCASPGVTIHYTTNGSTPTVNSPAYSTPIAVTASMTIKAFATRTGWTDSAVAAAAYSIVNLVADPTFTPPAGTYWEPKQVVIACATEGAEIRYTTNGSEPTATSTLYSTPVDASTSLTIRAKAFRTDWTASAVASAAYAFACAKPTFSPDGGTIHSPQSVTIRSATPGATIRFTTDRTLPTGTSPAYSAPIAVDSDTTVVAIATRAQWTTSQADTAIYVASRVPAPSLSRTGGRYKKPIKVAITCSMLDAVIRYTLNGSEPDTDSPVYADSVLIAENRTLRAKAFRSDLLPSKTATASYIIGLFYDFEGWDGNFISKSGWQHGSRADYPAYSGTGMWAMSLSGNYANSSSYELQGPSWHLDAGAVLSFHHRYFLCQVWGCADRGYVYASSDNGLHWTKLTSVENNADYVASLATWQIRHYDLSAYADQTVLVMFSVPSACGGCNIGWFIDDMQVTNATEAPKRDGGR